jgi:lipid-binding SYLF domain-containing protein
MNFFKRMLVALPVLALIAGPALADEYADAIDVFKKAGESASFFNKSYGYAVFPGIGKAGLGIGGAHGDGRVYKGGAYVGDTSMSQLTIGLQAGGQAYRQMIFFENKEAFDKFTNGNFEFGAQATAVAITAAASASTSTAGSGTSASSSSEHAKTKSGYQSGMAVFTIAKGGLMYEATLGGQKYKYKANKPK